MSAVPEPEIKCAGFIVFRLLGQIEYLLLQASDGIHHWTPPKGHLDAGEDLMQAASRETEEEAGFKPEDYNVIKDFPLHLDYVARGKTKRVYYWLAQLKDPNVPVKLSSEHQDYRWANAELAIKMSHNNMTDIIQQSSCFLKKRLNL
jgi:bis(5'-nucleosidyl)-tetraphosphatase